MAKKVAMLPVLGSIEKKSLKFAGSPDRKLYRISDLKNIKYRKPCLKTCYIGNLASAQSQAHPTGTILRRFTDENKEILEKMFARACTERYFLNFCGAQESIPTN
jgi:hypothetical protein